MPTDGELLRIFARQATDRTDRPADEPDAFDQLMDRHRAMVWAVCRQVLMNQQDAEDAFQATFLVLARRARLVRASESAAGWLYRVAFRTAVAAKRRARRRKEARLEHEPLAPPETAFPDLAGRETAATMMDELGKLPAKYRTPLVLRYLEGRSRREIAEQTDSTIAAVQGRLARGKSLLRSRLLRRGVSLSAAMAVVGGQQAGAAESAPAHVVTQTTSNATAVAAGGSVAASAVVVSLYREGVRAMFVSEAAKPLAGLAVACLIAATITYGGAAADAPGEGPSATPALTLDTAPSKPAEPDPPAIAVDVPAPAPPPAPVDVVYPGTYYVGGVADPEGKPSPLDEVSKRIKDAVGAGLWGVYGYQMKPLPQNLSLVVTAPDRVHEQISGLLEEWRNGEPIATAAEDETEESKLQPGQPIKLEARIEDPANEFGGESLRRSLVVERGGTIALGVDYGRVRVAGLTVQQAEAAVREQIESHGRTAAVQITESAPADPPAEPAGPRFADFPTPSNGAITARWPSGQTKAEYSYEEGRLVAATEYAEDGQVLYEYSDDGPRPEEPSNPTDEPASNPDDELARIAERIEQAERFYDAADKLTAETTETSRGRQEVWIGLSNKADRLLQQAGVDIERWTGASIDDADDPAALISELPRRLARVEPLLDRIQQLEPRQIRSMNLWNAKCRELMPENYVDPAEPIEPEQPNPAPAPDDGLAKITKVIAIAEQCVDTADNTLEELTDPSGDPGRVYKTCSEGASKLLREARRLIDKRLRAEADGGEGSDESEGSTEQRAYLTETLLVRVEELERRRDRLAERWNAKVQELPPESAAEPATPTEEEPPVDEDDPLARIEWQLDQAERLCDAAAELQAGMNAISPFRYELFVDLLEKADNHLKTASMLSKQFVSSVIGAPEDSAEAARRFAAREAKLDEVLKRADALRTRSPRVRRAWQTRAAKLEQARLEKQNAAAAEAAAPARAVVVESTPADGATGVKPGYAEVRVTFDRDMDTSGHSFTGDAESSFPPIDESRGTWWADKRTCVLSVKLEPRTSYRVGVNGPGHQNFRAADGAPAAVGEVRFTTGGRTPEQMLANATRALEEAEQAAERLRALARQTVHLRGEDRARNDFVVAQSLELTLQAANRAGMLALSAENQLGDYATSQLHRGANVGDDAVAKAVTRLRAAVDPLLQRINKVGEQISKSTADARKRRLPFDPRSGSGSGNSRFSTTSGGDAYQTVFVGRLRYRDETTIPMTTLEAAMAGQFTLEVTSGDDDALELRYREYTVALSQDGGGRARSKTVSKEQTIRLVRDKPQRFVVAGAEVDLAYESYFSDDQNARSIKTARVNVKVLGKTEGAAAPSSGPEGDSDF